MREDTDIELLGARIKAYNEGMSKSTEKSAERVGEDWPPLLSKKWLAVHFGCLKSDGTINRQKFRTHVLSAQVLELAGISIEKAYSVSTKTFNAIESMSLTKILRGFCFAILLSFTVPLSAQLAEQDLTLAIPDPIPFIEKSLRDTLMGQAVVADSTVRMVDVGGAYQYQKVMSTIVVDSYMVREYFYRVRSDNGAAEGPIEAGNKFYLITGAQIDPKKIMVFKTNK